VAGRYKTWSVFARSNAGIVGSNPTRGIDVYVYSVFVLGSGLTTDWSIKQYKKAQHQKSSFHDSSFSAVNEIESQDRHHNVKLDLFTTDKILKEYENVIYSTLTSWPKEEWRRGIRQKITDVSQEHTVSIFRVKSKPSKWPVWSRE
jgi:hypothetical protein